MKPSAKRAPIAQTYLELPAGSRGRRRIRTRMPTPQTIAAMGKGEGVLVVEDGGRYEVCPL